MNKYDTVVKRENPPLLHHIQHGQKCYLKAVNVWQHSVTNTRLLVRAFIKWQRDIWMVQHNHTPEWYNIHQTLLSWFLARTILNMRIVNIRAGWQIRGGLPACPLLSEGRWRTETGSFPGLIIPLSLAFCANSCRQTRFLCLLWFRGSDDWKRVERPVLLTWAVHALFKLSKFYVGISLWPFFTLKRDEKWSICPKYIFTQSLNTHRFALCTLTFLCHCQIHQPSTSQLPSQPAPEILITPFNSTYKTTK